MGFQWMCFPNSQIEINIRFFVLLLKEMQHNSLKSKKKSMKIKKKFQIFYINLGLYILHNIQWFKHEPTSGHWFLVRRFYKVRTMIMTLKIVPKKFGSMVFPWHGHDVCYSLKKTDPVTLSYERYLAQDDQKYISSLTHSVYVSTPSPQPDAWMHKCLCCQLRYLLLSGFPF